MASVDFILNSRKKAEQFVTAAGQDRWTRQQGELKRQQADFNNYLDSGNYTTENNQKYRDMATQAVADLDTEMKRYGKSSDQYKTLDSYKNYYQNSLPTFDRLDVGANVRDYLSYDQGSNKFNDWHSEDDYNTQKSYLDQQRQTAQAELDAIEDQTSADYRNAKSWLDQLDVYSEALEERNAWDRQFKDVNDYASFERSSDYRNSIQAKQTLKEAQETLKNSEATLKTLEMKFAGVDPAMGLTDQQMAEYNQMLQLRKDVNSQRENVLHATAEVAGLEKWQKQTAEYNLLSQYGIDADYEKILDDLIAARDKAEEGTEDWAKIDLQIRALAGENENGLNENGQYDENTLYGRAVMRDFDLDAAQKRLDEIDQELKDLGVSSSRFWGMVTNADNAIGVDAAGMIYTDENAVGESDPRVMALRQEKTELTRKMNSAAKFQEKDAVEKAFNSLTEAEHAALEEAGMPHLTQKGDTYYRDVGFDSTKSNGQLDNFRYLNDTEKLDALPEEYKYYADRAKEIRSMIVEALGAEASGKDIGYTVDDVLRLYEGDINLISGLLSAKDISDMDSDFARWNRQVLGVGTQAGLNQFVTGMRQAFSDDYIEPNKTSYKAQFTREDLKRYGNEDFVNGSNLSQVLFDTTQTTANMLPMIAASYLMTKAGLAPVAGELVGAGLMGLSSGGNTYQQALAEGWSKEDAKAYATILGAAEGAMQYLIGGISGLGGVGEEQLLKAAAGINNAAVRFATETGIHILSETAEELAQNRLQRYLDYKFGATDDADWYSWNDDDWYTVIVTALSTGAMEGLPGGLNAVRNTRLGNQLAGNAIPGKAVLKSNQARNELISQVGEAMKGNEALHETLTTIGTNMMEEGSAAYDLAQRMESGKAAKSAWNYGVLYSEILSEYQTRNGKDGVEDGMAAVIGGAIKYHEVASAKTAVEEAEAKAEEVRKANPGSEVLSANASALTELGVADSKQAQKYGALVNKVLSGTDLSESEMNALVGDSTAAKTARVLISQQSSNTNALQELNLTLTRGNTEAAREAINSQISEAREVKRQRKEANKAAVAQAAMESADKSEVSRAAQPANRAPAVEMGQDYVRADTRRTIEKADADVEAAQARLDQLKKMSYKDLAALHQMGAKDAIVEAAIDEDMTNEMAALQKRAEELNSVRFPSKEQRTQLADIRDRQAALKARMLDEYQRTKQRAKAARTEQQRNEESAAIAAKTNDSVDTIVVGGARMTRDAFVQDHAARLMQSNKNLTQKQANEQALARYNKLVAQTQKTEVKEEQKTEAKEEHKSKVKPEKREVVRRQKLDGKAHYWTGGTLEGVQYGAVTEAEAEQAIGKTELDFVNNVLSKLVNVTLIKSLPGENGKLLGANGIFYRDGRLYLDINAGTEAHQRSVILTAAHELTHFIRTYNGKAYDKLRDFVESEMKQKGEDIEEFIKREQDNYKVGTGKEMTRDKAIEEVVANACETMLTDANAIQRFAAENPTEAKTILDWLTDFFQRIADAFEDLIAIHPEAKAMQDNINSLRDLWLNALVEADANAVRTTIDDHVKTEVNAEGKDVATTSDNGEGVFNLKTWNDGGRTALEKFLAKRVKTDSLDQKQADEMMEQMDALYKVCEEYADGRYGPFSAWSNATVIMGKDGKPAFSVVKPNNEYVMNLDFSLVCKKRRALDAVFNEMIERGLMNRVIGDEMFLKMYPASIVQINNYIREAGFETACALCFVDTKRYLQAMKADEFCSIYNGLVNSLIEGTDRKAKYFNYGGDMEFFNTWGNRTGIETLPDFELNWSHINEVLRTEKPTSTLYRMADYIKKNPEGRKLAARGDFMSTNGIDAMTIDHARLLELFHAKQGNSNAKDVVSDTPYFNEVIKSSSFKKEKAYAVGGVRIQSFSDYVGRLVFDYIQMTADLAAKELPAHSYTKEYQFAMQFGKTGIKINMSLVPRVVEGGVAPGLDANGNYAWMDGQSFGSTVYDNNNKRLTAQQGYELAIQIQNADGYSANCGTIAVGVSDEHIRKMLDDPNIRMIIPYHKSGINHLLAEMQQIGKYEDYTKVQNTQMKNAKGEWVKLEGAPDFNWNDNLQRLEREGKGARECAQLYKDWCAARGYRPKFDDFAYHPNYYKVLEDFTAYDKDGATPAPLGAVQLNFPVEGDAFGSMQKLIQDGLQEDAVLQAKQDVGVKGIVDRIEAELPAWEAEFREKGDKFAIETSKESMAKTEMRDASFSLRNGEEATVYIKDGHRSDGSTVDFINEILDGRKLGETRNHNRMTYGKWVGIGKDGQVLGRVKFGKPYQINKNSPEYADAMIEGTEYDLKDGETKWYYPVVEKEDFRNNPKPITRNGNYGVYQVDGKSVTPEEAQASFSSRDAQYNNWAPEFYSKMANTINEWTNGKGQPLGAKMAANQVVGWLKGKGVKSEEIKWSGIIPYLEGKKTVTKEELQQVMAENEIKIETKVLGGGGYLVSDGYGRTHNLATGNDLEEYLNKLAKFEGISRDELETDYLSDDSIVISIRRKDTGEWLGDIYDQTNTRWSSFTIPGGTNYREILFKQPGLGYSNQAMRVHWMESDVLAHTRVQDFKSDGKSVLFVEELQSDLHNAGAETGFIGEEERAKAEQLKEKLNRASEEYEAKRVAFDKAYNDSDGLNREIGYLLDETPVAPGYYVTFEGLSAAFSRESWLMDDTADLLDEGRFERFLRRNDLSEDELPSFSELQKRAKEAVKEKMSKEQLTQLERVQKAYKEFSEAGDVFYAANSELSAVSRGEDYGPPPEVPFAGSSDTYHEYVMKHLLRMAAEGGYDAIAWTPSDVQIDRWRNEEQRGYGVFRALYDKKLVQFMNKYGKQWGTFVQVDVLGEDQEVWSVPVNDAMRKSVLETGQPLFSSRGAFQRERAEVDAEYSEAVAEGNEDWQKQLVAEAANLAGYTTHAYHGSPVKDITVFRTRSEVDKPQKMQLLFGTHFTTNKAFADLYARKAKNSKGTSRMTTTTGRTYGAYLDLGKSLDLRTAQNYTPGSEMYSLYEDLPENIRKKIQPREFTAYETAEGMGEGKYINIGQIEDALERMTPKAATEFLVSHGYNSVLYDARYNTGSWDNNRFSRDPSIIMLDANLIKSDEPITYDNDGNVIPLSERFNPEREDIRYSSRDANAPENSLPNPYPDKTIQHDILEHVRKGDLAQWLNEQKNAYDEALENAKERPPVIPAKGFVPRVTEKEKQAIEKRRQYLIQKKGAMKPSEKDATGYSMPNADEKGNRFHRFLQNVLTAKQTTPAHEQAKKFAFTDVAGTYVPDSNKVDLKWAKDVIHEDGMESAIKQFNRAAIAMDNSQHNITKNLALGQQLLIETSRQGDMQQFLDVLSSLTLLSSQAGKSLQAFRMLKQSGPIGELYYVEKAVKQLNERNAAKIQAGKMDAITIPEDFANAVLTAATEDEQDKAVDNLIAAIGKQVPVTFMDKWNAWRYLAMLGNARTHVRNFIGNAVFVPLRFTKNVMSAGGEALLTRIGVMDEQDRRKALVVSKELKDFAKQDAKAMQKELQGNGKYNPMREILDARQVLPGFLETLSRKNGQALEYEDWIFLSGTYKKALAQALAHSGYTLEEMLSGENQEATKALNRARVIAVEEAQKATYRDFNAAASMLNRLKRMETGKGSDKVIGLLIEGVLPFTKTPINILRRGVEYSPIGIASSIFEAAAKVKSGEFDMAEFIDHLSAGLTGSAVVVLGYLLSSLGYLRGKKDDKEEEFEKLQGYQDYSIQVGNKSATFDWAAPTALPLFTGNALYRLTREGEDFEFKDAWDAMMMIAEPMMSLSMLDGLNSVLSSASYAEDNQKLATVASSAFTSYLGQAFPTLAGQLARSIDGTRRATYVDKNSPVPSAIQRFVQSSIQNKTPIWEEQKIPYIDQWGREDTVNSKALGALENFFSPSYFNIIHTTDVDETLRELYDATKDSGVLPARIQNRVVKVNGEDRYLTAEQFVDISRYAGTTKYTMLTQLFSDPRYMQLTDEQKAKAVSKVYEYANSTGKYYIWNDYNLHGQGKWMEEMYDMPTEIQRFNRFWEYLESYLKLD